jgi:preprotein translocase subunit SecG
MLLYYSITALHVIVCVILVLVVLLQSGRGADLAGAFGGGATQTAFGSRGPASFLSKMTTIAAIVFMMTSLSLALMSSARTNTGSKSILETTKGEAAKPEKSDVKLPPVPTREQIQRAQEAAEAAKQQQAAPVTTPAKNENPAAKPSPSK